MKLELTPEVSRKLLAHAYPARSLVVLDISRVDDIITYNQRAKVFNLVASRDRTQAPDGQNRLKQGRTTLCIIYDQDTDELELIGAALRMTGRKNLYQGDNVRAEEATTEGKPVENPVENIVDHYNTLDRAELIAEVKALEKMHKERSNS